MSETPNRCPHCGVFYYDAEHICVVYNEEHHCPVCDAPSVFVTVAAPGTGAGWTCRNGHYEGTCRELTPEEVR